MDEDDKKHLISTLRATVASQKGGVELQALNSDYRELEGQNIPFRAMGFPTLEAYIRSLSNDFSIVSKQGGLYVIAKKNEALAHIQDLIQGQNNKKKTSRKPAYKSSRGKFGGYNSSNNRYSKKPSPLSYNSSNGYSNTSRFQSSKPFSKRSTSNNYGRSSSYDRDEPRDDGYSPPPSKYSPPPKSAPKKASPVRRKSPPTERVESKTSESHSSSQRKSRSDVIPTKDKIKSAVVVVSENREADKVPPPAMRKMPPPPKEPILTAHSAPRLLGPSSQILSQVNMAKMNAASKLRENNMVNLQITLDNDYYVPKVDEDLEMPNLSDQNELPPLSPNPQLERLLSQENTDPTSSDLYPPEYPPNQNTLPSDNISSSDASMLLEHFESLELSNDYPPDSPPSPPPFPPPNMAYLKSFLNQLKQSSHKEEQELPPSSLPDPEPCPSIPYLTALLQKLKHKEGNTSGNLPQSLPYPHELPSALDSFHNVPYLDTHGPLLPHQTLPVGLTEHNTSSLHFDSRTPFEGTSPNFLTDRSRSNFYSYQPEELGDALDQEVFEATQNIQTLPMKVSPQLPEVYTHLPTIQPNLPKHGLSTPSPIITNWPSSLPPSLPSPSLSMYNKPSSSKSSTPEVYIELPAGATNEKRVSHLAKYLFNEEPEIYIKDRQPDPKKRVFVYYAYLQVSTHPRISTLPSEYNSREEARHGVIQLALNKFTELKDERMAKTLKKTTEKLNTIIDRIYSLLRNSSNGMVASKIEELYEKKYEEILPEGWFKITEIANHPRLEVNSNAITTIVYAKVPVINYTAQASLPPLVLPEDDEWPVFVTLMTSVSSVHVKLVDDSNEAFFKMSDDLNTFMCDVKPDAVSKVEVGGLYCLYEEDCWLRVQVEEKVDALGPDHFLCKLIDHGEESVHTIDELYPLYDVFRTLPAQAIELYLPESNIFEELFDYKEVMDHVVGKTLIALIHSRESNTATLYNTDLEPPVNINHFIFEQVCQLFNVSSLPEENMYKESVYVSFISSPESCIYVQLESLMFEYLTSSIQTLVASDELNLHVATSAASLADCRNEIFLAKFDLDGVYYRATILELSPYSNSVSVRFIDFGNTDKVPCNNLIRLFETSQSQLCLIPPQAKKVNLAGFGTFTPDIMVKLTQHLNGDEPVILKMTAAGAQIHKRDKEGKIVNINSLVLGVDLNLSGYKGSALRSKKDNHSGPLNPPIIPPVGKIIDVLVETVSSPTNFWIRPEDSYNAWVELIEEMDEFYSEQVSNLQPVKPEDIMVGASFAFYYEDVELWQRVTINNKISSESVALFLVDFGKIITADTSLLCYLAPQFRKLPATAIKSKLHDIRPTFGDWTPEDNLRFQELCEPNKVFKCRVEEATPDLIKDREDVRLSVRLLDTHDPAKDIDLATLLVVEGRAKMNEE